MLNASLVVKLIAKPGLEQEVAGFLTQAIDLANAETFTPVWFALQSSEDTFWIVDAFATETDRQAHLDGPIAAALMANAERLLAVAPEINQARVLAAKTPG